MPRSQKCFYEVFTINDRLCLYLDIEYKFQLNTGKRPHLAMRAIRRIITQELFKLLQQRYPKKVIDASSFQEFNDSGQYCELDATSDKKFSRHLIIRPPAGIVFLNMKHCLNFINLVKNKINSIYHDDTENNVYGARKSDFFWYKSVKDYKNGVKSSIIDTDVYNSNQCLRLVNSAKFIDLNKRHFSIYDVKNKSNSPCSNLLQFKRTLACVDQCVYKCIPLTFFVFKRNTKRNIVFKSNQDKSNIRPKSSLCSVNQCFT